MIAPALHRRSSAYTAILASAERSPYRRSPACTALLTIATLAAVAVPARAQPAEPAPPTGPAPAPDGAPAPDAPGTEPPASPDLERARAHFERGEFAEARPLLVRAYEQAPQPAILFALGQVELNLGRPREAIAYYERFIATGPSEEQLSLAQQALGAAQMQLSLRAAPPPERPAPVRRPPRWDTAGTVITVLGGAAIAGGAGLLYYSRRLTDDESGTLADYDARTDRARLWAWTGAGVAAAGALALGAAMVRWRTSGGVELVAAPRPTGAAVSLVRRW